MQSIDTILTALRNEGYRVREPGHCRTLFLKGPSERKPSPFLVSFCKHLGIRLRDLPHHLPGQEIRALNDAIAGRPSGKELRQKILATLPALTD